MIWDIKVSEVFSIGYEFKVLLVDQNIFCVL